MRRSGRPGAILAGAVLSLWARWAWGDVIPAPVFSDGMVLQADRPAPLFGTAQPGEAIVVQCGAQRLATTAGADGRWKLELAPTPAGGPALLRVEGRNTVLIRDVLFGEVWIASGQSNMQFPLSRAQGAGEEIARADHPRVRCYRGEPPRWETCTPGTAGKFSAMAYFFAVELHRRLKVPVGILDLSVDGAVAQTFVSEEGFRETPELAARVARQTDQTVSGNFVRYFKPILPVGIRGAIWCQGEGNRGNPKTYRTLLPLLIRDWRRHWGQGDFPFLIVQLVNSQDRREEPWEGRDCAIREAQLETAREVPNTGLVVTIDLGVRDVHYPDKRPAGERLAVAARALAYGEKIEASGPLYESAQFEEGRAVVSFAHRGGGLRTQGDRLLGFLLAGPDGRFRRAEATIVGDRVVVTSSEVARPIAVRYAWERNPASTLCNAEGLPASPFRSDHFDSPYFRDEKE